MKIKTQSLSGPPLDWAVILCKWPDAFKSKPSITNIVKNYSFSTSGDTVIDIMEREGISVVNPAGTSYWVASKFVPETLSGQVKGFGPTLRIAVCRCFCTSKLGDEVDVPEELMK